MAVMAGMDSELNHSEKPYIPPPEMVKKEPKLTGLKHIGAIPKGCHLDTVVVDFPYFSDIMVRVSFEIVYQSMKSFDQKLLKKQKEISEFILLSGLDKIKADPRFEVIENIAYKFLSPHLPEQPKNGIIAGMTADEIIEKFGDELTNEQKNALTNEQEMENV